MHADHDLLEQQLWELLYDLLPEGEAAALRERIAGDPAVAAAYARVAARRELVAESLRCGDEDVLWTRPQEEAVQPSPARTRTARAGDADGGGERRGGLPRLMRAINVLACTAAAVLLAAVGYAWLHPGSPLRGDARALSDSFAGEHVRLIVSGPREVAPSGASPFTLTTATLTGLPRPAEVAWRFMDDAGGRLIAQGRTTTGTDGRAVLAPPADVAATGGRLEVEVSSGISAPVSVPLSPGTAKVESNLLLVKRFYAPGEAVLFRALARTPESLTPLDQSSVRFRITDPAGEVIDGGEVEAVSLNGVAAGEVQLPADAPAGWYSLARDAPVAAAPAEQSWFFVSGEAPNSSRLGGLRSGRVAGALGEAINSNAPAPASPKEEVAVTLGAGDGRFEGGAPLTVEVVSKRPEIPVLVAATSGDELVGQCAVVFPSADRGSAASRQSATIPLADTVAGRLRLIAYDYSQAPPQVLAERWVFREPSRFLNVQIEAAEEPGYAGGEVRYDIQVADETGKAVAAMLGVAVVETDADGNGVAPRHYFADQASRLADADAFAQLAAQGLGGEQRAATRGVEALFAAPVGEQPPLPEPPQVADNLAAVWAKAQADAATMAERRAEWGAWLGGASLGGGAVLLTVLLITGLLRIGVDARIWTPALAASLLLVGIGGAWLTGERSIPAPMPPLAFHTISPDRAAGDVIAAGDGVSSSGREADLAFIEDFSDAARRRAEPVLELDRLAGGGAPSQSGRGNAKDAFSRSVRDGEVSELLAERKRFSAEARSLAVPDEPRAAPEAAAGAAPADERESLRLPAAQAQSGGAAFRFEDHRREADSEQDAARQLTRRSSAPFGLAAPPADTRANANLAESSLSPFYARKRDSTRHPSSGVLYWNPRLQTDQTGRASVAVPLNTPPQPHRVVVEAHDRERIGRAEKEFCP